MIIGPTCVLLADLIELVVALFLHLDEGCELKSPRAKNHYKLAIVMAILAIVGMLTREYQLRDTSGCDGLGTYSRVTFIVAVITGLLASKKCWN